MQSDNFAFVDSRVLEELYWHKSIRAYALTLCNGNRDDADDLFSQAFTELLSKGDEKVEDIHSREKLPFYFTTMIRNIFLRARIQKNNMASMVNYTEYATLDSVEWKMDLAKTEAALGDMYFYYRGLLYLYLQHRNYKVISDLTKIPYYSVFFGVRRARKELKKALT